MYDADYQIYQMAKTLGQSEQSIRDTYTFDEIVERNLFDLYDDFVQRELAPKPKR